MTLTCFEMDLTWIGVISPKTVHCSVSQLQVGNPNATNLALAVRKLPRLMLGSPATKDYFNLKPISVVVKCLSLKQGASSFSACAGAAGCRESLEQEDARNTPASNSIALHPASYWCLVVLGREYGNTLHLDYSLLMFPLLTPSKVQSVGLTGLG